MKKPISQSSQLARVLVLGLFMIGLFPNLTVGQSCAGNCGTFVEGSCNCDEACWFYADCCSDICTICGSTGPEWNANCGCGAIPCPTCVAEPYACVTDETGYNTVITTSPYCCDTSWDGYCQLTYEFYSSTCAEECTSIPCADCIAIPDDCVVNQSAYRTVVENNPSCCETAWDSACQDAYDALSSTCIGLGCNAIPCSDCNAIPDACVLNQSAYITVINNHPNCCNSSWNSICQNTYDALVFSDYNGDNGCQNIAQYPLTYEVEAPQNSIVTVAVEDVKENNFTVITSFLNNEVYELATSRGSYISVRLAYGSDLIAQGYSPLSFLTPISGPLSLFVSWNVDDNCGTDNENMTATVDCISCDTNCPPGSYNQSGIGCVSCPPGTYCPGEGNSYPCEDGEFSCTGGAVTCQTCQAEFFSGTEIITTCDSYTWIDGNTYTESTDTAQFIIAEGAVNGCDSLAKLDLTISANPFSYSYSTQPAIPGFANGAANVDVSGGILPYSYEWDDAFMQTTDYLIGVFPGTYHCVVTDAAGCSISIEVFVDIDLDVPETEVATSFCNTTGYDLSDFISAISVANAEAYRWEFTPDGGSALPEYTRTGGNQWVRLQWVNGIQQGTTYDVQVKANVDGEWGDYGSSCTIATASDISLTEVRPQYHPTNSLGNNYNLCDFAIAYNISGATNYQWRFDPDSDPNNGNEILYTRGTGNAATRLSWVNGLTPASTYNVAVRAAIGSNWGEYGTVHSLILAQLPAPTVRSSFCGGVFAPNGYVLSTSVCAADYYQFEFELVGGGPSIIVNSANYVAFFNNVSPSLTPGDYNVRVRVNQNGVLGNFGAACGITVVGADYEDVEFATLRSTMADFQATLFPNPNAGDELRLVLNGLSEDNHEVMIGVYDIYGKQIQTEGFGHDGANLSRLVRFDSNLSMGMYMVQIVVDGEQVATERLVVK